MKREIWFKRKRYGWGWYPSTWQGWIIILAFIIYLSLAVSYFIPRNQMWQYIFTIFIGVAILIWICYKKGEKPRWSWGEG